MKAVVFAAVLGVARAYPCTTAAGESGTLDCSGACLSDDDCAFASVGVTTCEQLYTDEFCDTGLFATDAGIYVDFNCDLYSCDLGKCDAEAYPCKNDPPVGECDGDYTCGDHGSCSGGSCVCDGGYTGTTCESGSGLCGVDFDCENGAACTSAGVCDCSTADVATVGSACEHVQDAGALIPRAELDALNAFFHATGGANWLSNSNWADSTTAFVEASGVKMKGVQYYASSDPNFPGSVKELWLSSNKLTGQLSEALVDLPGLNFVDFDNNGLEGFLPYKVSELLLHDNLQMKLTNNKFLCPVPTALRPYTRTCEDNGVTLTGLEPSTALSYDRVSVELTGDFRDSAELLFEYPELQAVMTYTLSSSGDGDGDGDASSEEEQVVPVSILAASGPNSFTLELPAIHAAATASIKLVHSEEEVSGDAVEFTYTVLSTEEKLNYIEDGPVAAAQGLIIFTYIVALLFVLWIWVHRDKRVIKLSQPMFLYVIIFGCLLSTASIFPLSMDDNGVDPEVDEDGNESWPALDTACMLSPWLYCVGFVLTFGALFAKTWRVKKIFTNAKLKRIKITNADVFKVIGLGLFACGLVLAIWTASDPLVYKRTITSEDIYGNVLSSYGSCESDGALGYVLVLLVMQVLAYGYGVVISYQTRMVESEFSEAKWISFGMVNNLQTLLLAFPLCLLVYDKPTVFFVIKFAVIVLSDIGVLCLILLPKMYAFYFEGGDKEGMSTSTATSGATSMGTSNDGTATQAG